MDHFKRRGKLELLTGLIGAKSLEDHNAETRKNREAESAAVRRDLWGQTDGEGDDMAGQTILGDVTNPTPIVIAGQQGGSSALQTMATLALGGLLGGGGLAAGMMLNKAPNITAAPVIQQADETLSIGLGKIEDYLEQ